MPATNEQLAAAVQHHRAGRVAEAEAIYRGILTLEPGNPDALHLLGVIALNPHRALPQAIQLMVQAIAARPDRGDFHATMGNIQRLCGDAQAAAESYRRALAYIWFSTFPVPLGEILDHAGDPPRAIADLDIYPGQFFQDLFLDKWVFDGMEGGVFVDIGAHDGVKFSNSYFFEKVRNWTGVCIEPHPDSFRQLAANRRVSCVNAAVGPHAGELDFLKISGPSVMLSGLVNAYDLPHIARVEKEFVQFGGAKEIIRVPVRTFADIAAETGLSEVGFLSIDTEGGEAQILELIDFKRYFIHAAMVECNYPMLKDRLMSVMGSNGFELGHHLISDLLFLHRDSPYTKRYNVQHKRTSS